METAEVVDRYYGALKTATFRNVHDLAPFGVITDQPPAEAAFPGKSE